MLTGSCLCKQVCYEILSDKVGPVFYCHCSKCRKASGAAFATNALIDTATFQITSGEQQLAEYESSAGVFRVFCSHCASPLYSRRPAQPEKIRLRLGSLDSAITDLDITHIYVDSKASWYSICDDLPRYGERP